MGNPVVHFEVMGRDGPALQSFYGTRMMGPDEVMEGLVIGMFNDPEGHVVGVVKTTPTA